MPQACKWKLKIVMETKDHLPLGMQGLAHSETSSKFCSGFCGSGAIFAPFRFFGGENPRTCFSVRISRLQAVCGGYSHDVGQESDVLLQTHLVLRLPHPPLCKMKSEAFIFELDCHRKKTNVHKILVDRTTGFEWKSLTVKSKMC